MKTSTPAEARFRPLGLVGLFVATGLIAMGGSCTAFNPAFLNLIGPGDGSFTTIPNAPGHVVVAFVNNAEIDERLVDFLAPELGLSDAEVRMLRPRVRLRVRIAFTDGTSLPIEMIDGSREFVDPAFDASAVPDLNQNDLTNVVGRCDVSGVAVELNSIEVFVPVELIGFQLVEVQGEGGQTTTDFEERQRLPPGFNALEVDDVDDDGNTILQRNIGVRDVPSPTANVLCGSVISITMRGVLDVPFLEAETNDPSFDIDDEPTVARIGGRYEFDVSVQ